MSNQQVISGEEHHDRQHASSRPTKQVVIPTHVIIGVAIALVLCGFSFWTGVTYEKRHVQASTASGLSDKFGGGFGAVRRDGGLGQVTAVSSTSITITSQRTNKSKTYTINSSTTITDNGQPVTANDIQSGDTVLILTGNNSTTATRVLVNPSFGGGFGSTTAPGVSSGTNPTQTN